MGPYTPGGAQYTRLQWNMLSMYTMLTMNFHIFGLLEVRADRSPLERSAACGDEAVCARSRSVAGDRQWIVVQRSQQLRTGALAARAKARVVPLELLVCPGNPPRSSSANRSQ